MKVIICAFLFVVITAMQAKSQGHIAWSSSFKKTNISNVYELQVFGFIPKPLHLYSSLNAETKIELAWDDDAMMPKSELREQLVSLEIYDSIFEKKMRVYKDTVSFIQLVSFTDSLPDLIDLKIKGYIANFSSTPNEFLPFEDTIAISLERITGHQSGIVDNKGLFVIFLFAFGAGFFSLFTPCVFPMVPLTISYFNNSKIEDKSARRKARKKGARRGILYGLFIFSIYLLISIPFHVSKKIDAQLFNEIATNAWINLGIGVLLIIAAISFFGKFEIKLPSWLANKFDKKAGLSVIGLFFMALVLTIVSFSCTGPVLGTLLVSSLSENGSASKLTMGMGGFGLGLGLPFIFFALFPQWLNRLPRSGPWMDVLKKAFAYVELALALKFFSNADLVEHLGILKREIFIFLWLIIAILLALYLLGVVFCSKDERRSISLVRKFFAGFVCIFVLYLIPGLTNTKYANLKLLSGFPPPLTYSIYKKEENRFMNDYEGALKRSRETGKPILIDFTAWACINCREMEENVWTKPVIDSLIKNEFILVSLYVDDKKKLPQTRFVKDKNGKKRRLKTIGDKWSFFEEDRFGQVSQPLYAIMGPNDQVMNQPIERTNAETYEKWLRDGITKFKKQK